MTAAPSTVAAHYEKLRGWAKGIYPLEAATELLIRTGFAGLGYEWVKYEAGRPWIDFEDLPHLIAQYSGGEQRVLRIAAALGCNLAQAAVSLNEDVPGLDREHLALVLAAIAHAGGSHDHSVPVFAAKQGSNGGRVVDHFDHPGSLFPWPST